MNQFLQSVAEYLKQHRPDVQILRHSGDEDSFESFPTPVSKQGDHRLVEDSILTAHIVPTDGEPTAFTHFLDGIQRTIDLYFDEIVPVVYGYTAAAIRRRVDRQMTSDDGWQNERQALYLPRDLVDIGDMVRFGIDCKVTDPEFDGEGIPPLGVMKQAAASEVANVREALEIKLARNWLHEYGRLGTFRLMVDGSITDLCDEGQTDMPIVGVAKSHNTQYFNKSEDLLKIYRLKPGERSSVFIPISGKRQQVYSWYLRLRWQAGAGPTFGLIRVEAPPDAGILELVDQVSAWLMQESQPISLPDSRYDRLLYPIYNIEQYLKSQAPSHTVIQASLSALSASKAVQ
jgi:hypothetical protein